MAHVIAPSDSMPTMSSLGGFDRASGSRLERLVFNNRVVLIFLCVGLTLILGYQALQIGVTASYESMMPRSSEFIRNYQENKSSLGGLGNSVRIVVENPDGSIYDPHYLEVLKQINDAVFLLPGVDRSFMKSLWMPVVRWTEVTPDGYAGGPVMPSGYDGSPASVVALKDNVQRADLVGALVGTDERSSMLFVPLLDIDAETGKAFDYELFRERILEIQTKYEAQGVKIHVIGFAQLIGDLIAGLNEVFTYFVVAAAIAVVIISWYTRCWRSTLLVTSCSAVAVVWQMGLMRLLGFSLDPFSILVPFLIFAIGVSHGAQKMNGIMQDIGRGTHKYIAARYTFRRLFLAGLTALLADAVGFAVLAVIDIESIRGLAVAASIGVAALIFTNLLLIPVLLSFTGVSAQAAKKSLVELAQSHPVDAWLSRLTHRRRAVVVLGLTAVFTAIGWGVSQRLQIGDLDPGAPELRRDSTYNRDNAYITDHYALSSDQFAVIVKAGSRGIVSYETLLDMDRLEQLLRELPGVQTTVSPGSLSRTLTSAGFEGFVKWETINRNPYVVQDAINTIYNANPELLNDDRSVSPIIVYLSDHKAATLSRVVDAVQEFAKAHNNENRQFLLAAGNSGIEAATNIVVAEANRTMLLYVYLSVIALCFITFRSWRAVIVAVVPLIVTTILCEALMVMLGIGVKVATLPVTALGVGIGVDYSLYLLTTHLVFQHRGLSLENAFRQALISTGKVVALIGITLSAAVATWAWSPIKFQADMGVLLAFMFLWNMLGALIILPSLAAFLLPSKLESAELNTRGHTTDLEVRPVQVEQDGQAKGLPRESRHFSASN